MELQSEELRERMVRVFRTAAVGSCVNSVTHDVNNSLGAILAYSDLLGMSGNVSPESQRMLNQIATAVQKCSELISSLTSIARQERPDSSVVDVSQLCTQVVELRSYDFRSAQVDLQSTSEESIPSLIVDVPKLKMAIIYLLANALDAARKDDEPQAVPCERAKADIHVAKTSDGVEIIVSNSGPPVPDADRNRIFESFFSTKPPPHLGLGLALARDIARYHDGDLTYEPDRGFVLHLPRSNRLAQRL